MSDKFRRIGAWGGIVVLLGIYVLTLVSAILQKESTGGLFIASLFCTFVIPVWVFVLQAIYNRTHKDAIGKAEIAKIKKEEEFRVAKEIIKDKKEKEKSHTEE